MSALASKADIRGAKTNVRLVPIADIDLEIGVGRYGKLKIE
jgi:hypothetical protein